MCPLALFHSGRLGIYVLHGAIRVYTMLETVCIDITGLETLCVDITGKSGAYKLSKGYDLSWGILGTTHGGWESRLKSTASAQQS